MTNVACGAVFVVGKRFDDYGNAVRAVTFVNDGFVVNAAEFAACFLNAAANIVVRHISGLCFCDNGSERRIAVGVGTARFNRNRDLTTDFGKNLRTCRVGLAFCSFDCRPFAMPGHI